MRKLKSALVLSKFRPAKTTNAEFTASPTDGNIKFNSNAAAKLGINYSKGKIGEDIFVLCQEVEGNIYVSASDEGSKVAGNWNGGTLGFSSQGVYQSLKGDENHNHVWLVGDEKFVVSLEGSLITLAEAQSDGTLNEEGEYTDEDGGTPDIMFKLSYLEMRDKRSSVAMDEDGEDDASTSAPQSEATADPLFAN